MKALTPRQEEVLHFAVLGHDTASIALLMGVMVRRINAIKVAVGIKDVPGDAQDIFQTEWGRLMYLGFDPR